jgi:ParB-like chromosome segregation protein Spo0J
MAGKTDTTPSEIAGFGLLESIMEGLHEKEATESQLEDIKNDAFQFRKLIIDPEFKNLMPPLTKGEYEKLKEGIKTYGCLHPLTIWKDHGILADGHYRYEICMELGIPFKTVECEFANRSELKIWMINNPRTHRNLKESQNAMLAVTLEALYGEQAKERQGIRTDLGQKLDQSEKGRSAEKAAKDLGVSHQTVAYAKKVSKKGIPDLIKMVESGEAKVSTAAKVASHPVEVQEKIVEKALNQIQEGKKPKIAAIIKELASEIEDVTNDEGTISESAKDEPIDNQDILEVTDIDTAPDMDVCDPWRGPWVCTHKECNAFMTQMGVCHAPVACTGCGRSDGIKRLSVVGNWKPK